MTTPAMEEPEPTDQRPDLPLEGGDDVLRILVSIANKHALNMGITLNLGGSLVSGTLVSLKTYSGGVADSIRAANGHEDVNAALARLFEDLGGDAEDETEPPPPRHIHLRDARLIAPNGGLGPSSPWWRGRISAVSGWTMGSAEIDD
ncbi:hypothetical protein [Nocardioides sp. NPDC047086]|uniref:hypothetical protein n=1 Tax=Nocardioides sp. NPDC047086 TaxID=3154810 RepID=UPI0033DF298B